MQTRRLTQKRFRSLSSLALANGALLLALSGSAQAQTTRSRPQPSEPSHSSNSGGSTNSHSSHPSQSPVSSPKSGAGKSSGSWGSGHWQNDRSGNTVSRGGHANYKVLFPTEKTSVVKSATPNSAPTNPRLPKGVLNGGPTFGPVFFPRLPDFPDPDSADSDKDRTDKADNADSSKKDTVTVSVGNGKAGTESAGNGKNGTNTTSQERYNASQEATAAKTSTHNSQIPWHNRDDSPFWAYSVSDVFWLPGDVYSAYPDGNILFPTPSGVILGWPNYDPKVGAPRNEPDRNYRIGEKKPPRREVDLDPALEDIQRAFQEGHARLLGSHLPREDRLVFNRPGEARDLVAADRLLEELKTLFTTRDSMGMEFDAPEPLDSDLFAIKAWYVYRNQGSPTVYRAQIRLVLQAQDNRIVLTAFEMD
ncbi:MAG: hypothetical protein JWN14_3050 [Chthonomonadales bacterium]|nr:hypothetical protein [Chthonomonadales bacterium]